MITKSFALRPILLRSSGSESSLSTAFRRSVFEELGGFENAPANEDMLFAAVAIKSGYAVYYSAEACIYHSHNYSLGAIFKRYFKIGRFFAEYKQLLLSTKVHGEGKEMFKKGIVHLWEKDAKLLIACFIIKTLVKTTAYNLGLYLTAIKGLRYHKVYLPIIHL